MLSRITIKQNEEKAIAMLAAQRAIYDSAKSLSFSELVVSVCIPFSISLIDSDCLEMSGLQAFSYAIAILCLIISFPIEKKINRLKDNAAHIQQAFDVYVFDMPWDETLFGAQRDLRYKIVEKSKKILSNSRKKGELYNWYRPEIEGKEQLEAISICQMENIYFDSSLRQKYKTICVSFIVMLSGIVFLRGVVLDEPVRELLRRVVFILPMLRWLMTRIKKVDGDLTKLIELKQRLNDCNGKTMDDLQITQKLILEHRKECLDIPSLVYKVFKGEEEEKAKKISLFEK